MERTWAAHDPLIPSTRGGTRTADGVLVRLDPPEGVSRERPDGPGDGGQPVGVEARASRNAARKTLNFQLKAMYLPTDKILTDETLYPPEVPDQAARLTRYAEALCAGAALPAVTVGKTRRGYVIIDGRARLEAHRQVGKRKIAARVTPVPRKLWRAESFQLNAHRLSEPLPDQGRLDAHHRQTAEKLEEGVLAYEPLGAPAEELEMGTLDRAVHPPVGPGTRLVKTPLVSLPEEKGQRAKRAANR